MPKQKPSKGFLSSSTSPEMTGSGEGEVSSPSVPQRERRRKNSKDRMLSKARRQSKKPSGLQANRDNSRATKRRGNSLRAGLAVLGGRAAGAVSRRLHLGGGTSITGIVAERVYPDIVHHLASQLQYGSIIVTGTNGKTTTSGFIAAILSDAGLRVWRNREGSNLMRGVAGALVIRAHVNGQLRRAGKAVSIFETDEAVVPQLVRVVSPRVAVFTNLFRDQLDRYGEVDTVAAGWREAIALLPENTILVLNADDPTVASLGEAFPGQVLYFGIEDPALDLAAQGSSAERYQVMDTRTCPKCGGEYIYTLRFYSHMGHYVCSNCGQVRPQPEVRAVKVYSDSFDRIRMEVQTPIAQGEVVIPLPGLYNVYNALAAIATAQALGISWEPIASGIGQYKPAFGRGERVQAEGRTLRLLLAKNPTGFNEVLRTLFSEGTARHVLFVLNDNIADGRDISWIWDVDFERVVHQTPTLVVAGTRALDLALRLKYAGIKPEEMTIVRNGIGQALDVAIHLTPEGETLFVVPTYTGLLEVHHELERRGLTPHYWEEKGP